MSPSSSDLLLAKTITHPAAWSLCDSWASCSSRRDHEKKGHYKKSQRGYISPICGEFPTQPNLTKIGVWVGVAHVINHTKFCKSVQGVQSYGGSNFGLLHRNGLSPNTVARLCYMWSCIMHPCIMAAANFVVITNGEGCTLNGTVAIDQQRATFFLSASCDWLKIVAKIDRNYGGALIGGYMIWFAVNRRYGIWNRIFNTDLW